ncbi:hypothetical protein EYF80_048210 [Liparis tanakae]|uniref:Uncharacterized protein n=1 Tax=Liparis tanakae TaxID=230148 RepID=A0A4Z2FK52_9TELE|nr:hypothetical protein EYF80_048210 [Liparis tanakae]
MTCCWRDDEHQIAQLDDTRLYADDTPLYLDDTRLYADDTPLYADDTRLSPRFPHSEKPVEPYDTLTRRSELRYLQGRVDGAFVDVHGSRRVWSCRKERWRKRKTGGKSKENILFD